jgi:hypothetical protein
MTYPQKTKVHWDQSAFEALKATWSPERVAEDEKRLREIFNLAAEVPLLKEALDWANTHGIKFFIDRSGSRKDLAGYYKTGTGALGILEDALQDREYVTGTIVHEIRHAWQEYCGLAGGTGTSNNFTQTLIGQCLIEADAYAFGERARDEYRAAQLRKIGQPVPVALQSALAKKKADLGEKFLSWFSNSYRLGYYGRNVCRAFDRIYKITSANNPGNSDPPKSGLEFSGGFRPIGERINSENAKDIFRLGQGFSRTENYLSSLPTETLSKKVLSPSLAMTFYGAADAQDRALATKLREATLRIKYPVIKLPKKLAHRLQART